MYYSKLLLFGEYIILNGANALTMPLREYSGLLDFMNSENSDEFAIISNKNLESLYDYIKKRESLLRFEFNLKEFGYDIVNGLFFHSNIPSNYGVGSSGALCAAIYQKYAQNNRVFTSNIKQNEISLVRKNLSFLESYFHGSSSGIDPLSSYLNAPLFLRPGRIITVQFPSFLYTNKLTIFLLDTGIPAKTGNLVDIFKGKRTGYQYSNEIQNEYIPLSNKTIENFLDNRFDCFLEGIFEISKIQTRLFKEMIPEGFKSVWLNGLKKGSYCLKLCGSGGGGFLLGFCENYEEIINNIGHYGVTKVSFSRDSPI